MTKDLFKYSDEELFSMLGNYEKENEEIVPQMGEGETIGRNLFDALSLGAGNKATAATTAALLKATGKAGNKSYKQLYNEINQEEKQKLEQSQLQHPFLSTATQIAGDVALGIPALERLGLAKGGSYLQKVKQGTQGGALFGAARGIGTSETSSEILPRSIEGGIKGGLAGGGGAAILEPVIGLAGRTANIVSKSAKNTPEEEVIKNVLPRGKTSEALSILETSAPESEIGLADIGGDSIRGLTRSVAKFNNGAKDLVTEALEGRSNRAVERLGNILSKDVSDVDTYFGKLDDLIAGRSAAASPFLEKAKVANPILRIKGNEELFQKILPELKSVRKQFKIVDKKIPDNSLIILDKVKKSLYDKAETLKRQGAKEQAREIDSVRRELTGKLKDLNSNYKKGLEIFEDESQIINAQQEGLSFDRFTPEQLKKAFNEKNIPEKEGYRIGVKENLQQIINKTPEGADPAKKIFGNTAQRERLKIILGPKYDEFKAKMLNEIEMAKTKFQVLGGSRTDININNDAEFIDALAKGMEIAKGDYTKVLSVAVNSIRNRAAGLNKRNAVAVAKALINKEEGIRVLKNIINKEEDAAQKRILQNLINQLGPSLGISSINNDHEANQ